MTSFADSGRFLLNKNTQKSSTKELTYPIAGKTVLLLQQLEQTDDPQILQWCRRTPTVFLSHITLRFQKNGVSQISHLSLSRHGGAIERFGFKSQQTKCPVSSTENNFDESCASAKQESLESWPLKTEFHEF